MDAESLAPGALFAGRYRVQSMLGSDPVGAVLAALDEVSGQRVALRLVQVKEGIRRRRQELQRLHDRLAALALPGVTPVIKIGAAGTGLFLVRELARPGTLGDERHQLPTFGVALEWAQELLAGLVACHADGLVHGDIRPTSVLLHFRPTGTLRAELADFGLARIVAGPEGRRVGPALVPSDPLGGDLAALCGLLYQLLSGTAPFDWVGLEDAGLVRRMVPRADLDVPEHLIEVIMAGLGGRALSGEALRAPALAEQLSRLSALTAPRAAERPQKSRRALAPRPKQSATTESGHATAAITEGDTVEDVLEQLTELAHSTPGIATASVIERAAPQRRPRVVGGSERGLPVPSILDSLVAGAAGLHGRMMRADDGSWTAALPLRRDRTLTLIVTGSDPESPVSIHALERLELAAALTALRLEQLAGRDSLSQEEMLRGALLDVSRDGVLVLTNQGVVRALNETAATLLGVSGKAAVGRLLGGVEGLDGLARLVLASRRVDGAPMVVPGGRVNIRAQVAGDAVVASLEPVAGLEGRRSRRAAARYRFEHLVGADPTLGAALLDARQAARADVPVLISGETGTGKETLAQAIHNASRRASGPFVTVDVAATPRELLESELFGYERGAFSGARVAGHPGKFELAHGGTLLLDEVGDMPMEVQVKLLRALRERVVTRLGSTRQLEFDARVIATTHRDLDEGVRLGTFRLDLLYRLRVVHLSLPPLRQRPGDLELLIEHFVRAFATEFEVPPMTIAPDILAALRAYHWPGNVRELSNLIEGWTSLLPAEHRVVDRLPTHIRRALERPPAEGSGRPASPPPPPRPVAVTPLARAAGSTVIPWREVERHTFEHALRVHEGNISRAAKALGVSRGAFYNKIRRYGLADDP